MLQALWRQMWTLTVTIGSANVAISCMVVFFLEWLTVSLAWSGLEAAPHCITVLREDEGQVLLGKYEQSHRNYNVLHVAHRKAYLGTVFGHQPAYKCDYKCEANCDTEANPKFPSNSPYHTTNTFQRCHIMCVQ